MAEIPIRVLGGVRLEGSGGTSPVGGRLAERLLGALVVAGDHGASVDSLTEILWPERPPDAPVHPVRMAVSRLRKRLTEAGVPGGITAERGIYRLAAGPEAIDVERFRVLADGARLLVLSEPDRAAAHFDGALALWRGDPFGPLADEPWAMVAAASWNELRLDIEEEAAELELGRHRESTVIGRLRLAVEREPLRERRWAQLAICLYRLGRQGEALRAVARARTLLREELGAEPGEALRRVEQGLLAQDLRLLTLDDGGPPPTPLASRLLGRDSEVAEVLRLLEVNRVVTLHGLGGVGKSAVARAIVRERRSGGGRVAVAGVDGLSARDEVCLVIADALGVPGACAPADLAAAAAGRGTGVPFLLVLDGVEGALSTIAELLDAFGVTAPELTVLATSRVPVGASDEIRVAVEPLRLWDGDSPGPAVDLFLARSSLPPEEVGADVLSTVLRVCERTAGLPLALELAAGRVDSDGLDALERRTAGPEHDAVVDSVRWSLGVLPDSSREVLEIASLLPDGLAADQFPPLGGLERGEVRRLLAPLLQMRLAGTVGLRAGSVRYRSLEPVREVIAAALSPEVRAARTAATVARLVEITETAGGVDRQLRRDALPAIEAELANVRHWLSETLGTEVGLRLAVAMSDPMSEFGLGAEGGRWIDAHSRACPDADPVLLARAALAAVAVRGFFAGLSASSDDLEAAARVAEDHEEWRLWLAVVGRIALARAWSGDVPGARALIDEPEGRRRLRSLGDPWLEVHLERLAAFLLAGEGDIAGAQAGLRSVTSRFHEIDDLAAVLSTIYFRSYLARMAGDDDLSMRELMLAREMSFTGAARATQALVAAELAQHARRVGDASALAMMTEAVASLENAGNLRAAAVARRDVGTWRLADGDPEGLLDLHQAFPTLLLVDRQAAAPLLAEIAAAVQTRRPRAAARLAGAAGALRHGTGTRPSAAELKRFGDLIANVTSDWPDAAAEGAALGDHELVALAIEAGS